MSRMKLLVAVLAVTAIVGVVPMSHAQTVETMIAGSSAQWQSMALAAMDECGGISAGCAHYTNSSFNLVDSRGSSHTDTGAIWVVWNSAATEVWAFIKVDSGVGDRCYYAAPRCNVSIPSWPNPANPSLIQLNITNIWSTGNSDVNPPTSIQNLFDTGTGVPVGVAATDIRGEDALWATCRTNSNLSVPVGLGYDTSIAAGKCPAFPNGGTGTAIASFISSNTATPISWVVTGKDPITGTTLPGSKFIQTVSVGAAAVIPIVSREAQLAGGLDISDAQAQTLWSGSNCAASQVSGAAGGNINVWLREPLSGTYNTWEANVMYYNGVDNSGIDQETNVNGTNNGAPDNPLQKACTAGGTRYRGVGTGDIVKAIHNAAGTGTDAIGYTFFSYGNVSSIASNSDWGYLTLDGVDGVFHVQGPSAVVDPGQPSTEGNLPGTGDLPASCSGTFPCAEGVIWGAHGTGTHGLSYPNVRNGSYRAWSLLRGISDTCTTHTCPGFPAGQLTAYKALITKASSFNVSSVPDYIPYGLTTAGGQTDPGLKLLRSHFQQYDGTGVAIGGAPVNISATGDVGGDMGGCILDSAGGVAYTESDTTIQLFQAEPEHHCVYANLNTR
jgi:ABC-type phosphate transport system substrate-binding protein